MRALSIVACLSVVSACGSSAGDASPSREDGGVDAGVDAPPAAGAPFQIAPLGDIVIAAGDTASIAFALQGDVGDDELVANVTGLPPQVTTSPTHFSGARGAIVLSAAANAPQGTSEATLEVSYFGGVVKTTVTVTVRGRAGSTAVGFGTAGGPAAFANARVDSSVDLVLAPDDSTYAVAVCSGKLCVAHLDAKGRLDSNYGTNGLALATFDAPRAAALDNVGRLVVVGGEGQMAAVRFTAAGVQDTTFGNAGVLAVGTAGLSPVAGYAPAAIAVRGDGHLFIAFDNGDQACLEHLDAAGAPVTTFGSGGAQAFGTGLVGGIVVQPTTVFMFWAQSGTGGFSSLVTADTGALHPTQVGTRQVDLPSTNAVPAATGALVLVDGSSIAPLSATGGGVNLFKTTATGAADTTFGVSQGISSVADAPRAAASIAADAAGHVLLGVGSDVVRFDGKTGEVDPAFGNSGIATPAPPGVRRIVVQKAGLVVVLSNAAGGLADVTALWN